VTKRTAESGFESQRRCKRVKVDLDVDGDVPIDGEYNGLIN
jgi:hypothetical protein